MNSARAVELILVGVACLVSGAVLGWMFGFIRGTGVGAELRILWGQFPHLVRNLEENRFGWLDNGIYRHEPGRNSVFEITTRLPGRNRKAVLARLDAYQVGAWYLLRNDVPGIAVAEFEVLIDGRRQVPPPKD
jgi:hypothetical protein